jgi:hypothetical protein
MGSSKTAKKVYTGTFYIVDGKIAYTLDTDMEHSMDHYELWPFVVSKIFYFLDHDTKRELSDDAIYGADRGRVVFKGERTASGAFKEGTFSLYGTPGCEKHEAELKRIFGLTGLPKNLTVETDFHSDPHYRVQPQDKKLLDSVLKSVTSQFEQVPQMVKIAGWPRRKNPASIKIQPLK